MLARKLTITVCVQGLKEKSLVNETLDKVDKLKPIAEKVGASLAQLGLAWCVANEHCSTVIMGATKEHQVLSTIGTWTFEALFLTHYSFV